MPEARERDARWWMRRVAWARETGTKLMPLCPYARSVFEKDASLADVWHK